MPKQGIEFLSQELWATWRVLGTVVARTPDEMGKRTSLMAICQFTAEEKLALDYQEVVTSEGQQDTVNFTLLKTVSRRFSKAQRKEIARVLKAGVVQFPPLWIERWIIPTLEKLGYPLEPFDWDDDEDGDE